MPAASRTNTFGARVSRLGLRLMGGWKLDTPLPDVPKSVILAVPHTSNRDGFLLVLLTRSAGFRCSWMVKDTWTKPPIGWLTKPVGAVPVNRRKATGMVDQMADQFASRDEFHLIIPPEGTRSRADFWKSGFYRIALAADVPVVPAYCDYRKKVGGFGAPIRLSGDLAVDMDAIRSYYGDASGMARYPAKSGPIGLRDEVGPPSGNASDVDQPE